MNIHAFAALPAGIGRFQPRADGNSQWGQQVVPEVEETVRSPIPVRDHPARARVIHELELRRVRVRANRENNRTSYEKSFTTPIVLPVGSKLEWRYSPLNSGGPFKINLIGRLATL